MKKAKKTYSNKINSKVSVTYDQDIKEYPKTPPFNPSKIYPEYKFNESNKEENKVYDLVRESLMQLNLDKNNMGTKLWNPFKDIIKPGSTVLIKPNFVKDYNELGFNIDSLVTHGSVLRPIIDYVYIALKGKGKIILADTPLESTDFEKVCKLNGVSDMINILRTSYGLPIELIDLRTTRVFFIGEKLITKTLDGDPEGYTILDLQNNSFLTSLDDNNVNYYTLGDHTINHYNPYEKKIGIPNSRHGINKHQYSVGNTILKADTIISVAKLKTHRKAGITLNLKNMIGIINGKEFIPHHRPGPYPFGDSFMIYPSKSYVYLRKFIKNSIKLISNYKLLYRFLKFIRKDILKIDLNIRPGIEWGDWHGNDTIWRTILDINKILLFSDKKGNVKEEQQRNYFCFIDGIIGMEGDGPYGGNPYNSGIIIAGNNPVSTDVVATEIMGFNSKKIKQLSSASHLGENNIDKIYIKGNLPKFNFKPATGWKGSIEREHELLRIL